MNPTGLPADDILMMHARVRPKLRHDLQTIAIEFSGDVPLWKDNEDLRGHTSDDDLYARNAMDCITVFRAYDHLLALDTMEGYRDPHPTNPWGSLADLHAWMQECAVGMHQQGMLLDQVERERWAGVIAGKLVVLRKEIAEYATKLGVPDLNPNSHKQMVDVLYMRGGLLPCEFTATGDAAVTDEVIRDIVLSEKHYNGRPVSPDLRALMYAVRRFRKVANKMWGTYVAPMAPDGGFVRSDGRVHADWKAHGTPVNRYSVQKPGLQQIPNKPPWNLRSMYVPGPGRVFVSADVDQFHPRIFGSLWDIDLLLSRFETGRDPYVGVMLAMYPGAKNLGGFVDEPFKKCKGPSKKPRAIAKEGLLAYAYGGTDETMYTSLRKLEDDEGNLVMAHITKRDAARIRKVLHDAMPEFEPGWAGTLREAEENGQVHGTVPFLVCRGTGRRVYFENGLSNVEERNVALNCQTLLYEAYIMRLAEWDLLHEIPFGKYGPGTGMAMQYHDAPVLEVPLSLGVHYRQLTGDVLCRTIPGLKVPIKATGEASLRWDGPPWTGD